MKEYLKNILNEICAEEKIKCTSLSKGYILALEKNGKCRYISGSYIGNNSFTSKLLADDKYAMYEVLKNAGVPVIEYELVYDRNDKEISGILNKTKEYYRARHRHIVLKPNRGFFGRAVYNIEKEEQIEPAFNEILKEADTIVANPFYDVKCEHRVIVLNGEVRLAFTKNKENSKWQFNIYDGAKKIESAELEERLSALAKRAYDVIGANFVSVDIFETKEGGLKVLEINGTVFMGKYFEQYQEEYEKVKNIYKDAILGMFEK